MAGVEVVFTPKETWQKDNCLFCGNQSVLQANAQKGRATAAIRCCRNEACKSKAANLARESVEAFE